MEYIKLFDTDSEYQEFVQDQHSAPNVSYVIADNKVYYELLDLK